MRYLLAFLAALPWAVAAFAHHQHHGQAGSINRRVLNLGVPMLAETAAEQTFCGGLQ